jgi:gustatory receptor
MLAASTKRARALSISNLCLGAFISTCFVTYPLFASDRTLPYGVYIPFLDTMKSPTYEILFIVQALLTFPGCCMYIPYTSFFATSTIFGLVQIKALKHDLRNINTGKDTNEAIDKKLSRCIEAQKKIIKYVEEINGLVEYICLFEFITFGVMLCALLFLLNIVSTYMDWSSAFLLCFPALD